jgi:predicted metal-binding membrane protein
MTPPTGAERLVAKSRAVTLLALAVLALLAWLYLLSGAGMKSMASMAAPGFALTALMWWTMMVAMMVPSAAPAILLYARVHRQSYEGPPPTAAFLAGYLACWLGFSLLAAALQLAVASPMSMALDGRTVPAALLIAAGLYQLSPFKESCLAHCRTPTQFLSRHYRPGAAGAWRLGLIHGA